MKITITGIDYQTSASQLFRLMKNWPRAEVGLLYTTTPNERNRYPSISYLANLAFELGDKSAIHICGSEARHEMIVGGNDLQTVLRQAGRVQINGNVTKEELLLLAPKVRTIITQHNLANQMLANVDCKNHEILMDTSSGRGLLPDAWTRAVTSKPVGFAGGLGPDNLNNQLVSLSSVVSGHWWVDMESGLRTNDWFDIDKAERVLEIFHKFCDNNAEMIPRKLPSHRL